MIALKLFVLASLIGFVIWAFVDPGYDSITATVLSAGCFLAIRVNERAQKNKRTFNPKKY
jgi:hypothetical protein